MRSLEASVGARTGSMPSGIGDVRFTRVGGRTVVTRAFSTSPLKLLHPNNAGHAAWIYTSTYGGGLVGGDALSLTIDVAPGAAAFVSTQASTKVYRSAAGVTSALAARVGEGALLAVVPDPVVCFAGASCRQAQTYDVDADGALVCVDWLAAGRRASGERWAFDNYEGRLSIRSRGRPIAYDALALRRADGDIAPRLDRFNVLALIAVAGRPLAAQAAAMTADVAGRPVRRRPSLVTAASRLGDEGCIVRIAGESVEEVGRAIRAQLAYLPSLLGDDPWARKW